VFGLPGGCILPAYDPLLESTIRHILVRHEQGAGHMAEGYAHVTGRPGVADGDVGPAATNLVTPLMDAFMDSIPMVAITGQVSTAAIGSDAFQECDTVGITRSVDQAQRARDARRGPARWRSARRSTSPRPAARARCSSTCPRTSCRTRWSGTGRRRRGRDAARLPPDTKGHPRMIKEAAKLILAAERPVLYVGGGILKARAAEALRELAELTDIHVVTTLMARGAFPDDHPLCLGMPGMHGNATAVTALQRSDLLIALGPASTTASPARSTLRPDAKVIHVDIDPAEQGKVRRPTCRSSATAARDRGARQGDQGTCSGAGTVQADTSAWRSRISGWREQFPLTYEQGARPGDG
jgi:acetolactate synthase-1/2/3 large subunit